MPKKTTNLRVDDGFSKRLDELTTRINAKLPDHRKLSKTELTTILAETTGNPDKLIVIVQPKDKRRAVISDVFSPTFLAKD